MQDSISDMIIRLKNAACAGKSVALVPYSGLKQSIADVLVKSGYLKSTSKKARKAKKFLEMELSYDDKNPRIHGVERISKSSRRVYRGAREIFPVMQGYGMAVVSTPKGIMSDKEARHTKVGGELLFKVW